MVTHQHNFSTVDMLNATTRLQIDAAEVRAPNNKPNWTSYLRSQIIPQEYYNFIVALESAKDITERNQLLNLDRFATAKCVIGLITGIPKDQLVRYMLTLFDDLLQEDKSRVEIFHDYGYRHKATIWSYFHAIFSKNDNFIVNQMYAIFAKLACLGSTRMEGKELLAYFNRLTNELKIQGNEYINTSARCLQMMLRIDKYRLEFVHNSDGLPTIMSVLNGRCNFQLQYQLIFCIWCLSFNESLVAHIINSGIIQTLGDILAECSKEKVTRIIVATFRNLLEKVSDQRELVRDAALQMVQCKSLKTLEFVDAKKFDDSDIQDDIEALCQMLHSNVQDLSSFDEYCTELRSGRLHWSPVHRSEKFWKENAQRFNEKHFELIKILIHILESTNDPLILCVAMHDIGEYVRHYPRGKNVVEQYQGKQAVMRLLSAEDPNVRYHALLAIQKLMVHNWEYLGRQFVEPNSASGPDSS